MIGIKLYKRRNAEMKVNVRVKTVYSKPNMCNLNGRYGRRVITEIRHSPIKSTDHIRQEADECMKRILAGRKNG